uniref:Transmembrane protein n=1 Tax=viral metagenome TaxID=1070528 RepID=A0A6C0DBN5_9ZZZZ
MNTGDNFDLDEDEIIIINNKNEQTIIEDQTIVEVKDQTIVEVKDQTIKENQTIVEVKDQTIKSLNLKKTICLSISAILFLVIGSLILFIFDIIGLVTITIPDVYNKCPTSSIWYYVLISLIIGSINLYFQSTKKKNELICNDIIVLFECIIMFIWGAYELFGNSCVNTVNDTILFKVALCHWIISTISTCIIIFSILLFCIK